jgi:hypothetical protein
MHRRMLVPSRPRRPRGHLCSASVPIIRVPTPSALASPDESGSTLGSAGRSPLQPAEPAAKVCPRPLCLPAVDYLGHP